MGKYLLKNKKSIFFDKATMARVLAIVLALSLVVAMLLPTQIQGADNSIHSNGGFCQSCCVVVWHGDEEAPNFDDIVTSVNDAPNSFLHNNSFVNNMVSAAWGDQPQNSSFWEQLNITDEYLAQRNATNAAIAANASNAVMEQGLNSNDIDIVPTSGLDGPTGNYYEIAVTTEAGLREAIALPPVPGYTRVINLRANITISGQGNLLWTERGPVPASVGTIQISQGRDIWIRTCPTVPATTTHTIARATTGGTAAERNRLRHFRVIDGGTLTISRVEIFRTVQPGGGIWVAENGTFNMEAGSVIRNNGAISLTAAQGGGTHLTNNAGGGVQVEGSNAVFNMNGGVIRNNSNASSGGSGVFVNGSTAIFNWTNGVIHDNSGGGNLGAVRIMGGAQINMHGGAVRNNTASGGIRVEGTGTTLTMTGNVAIHSNAGAAGLHISGGAQVTSDTSTIDGVHVSGAGSTFTSTASGLQVSNNASGAGLYIANGAIVTATITTISNNSGVGLRVYGATTVFNSTIDALFVQSNGGHGIHISDGVQINVPGGGNINNNTGHGAYVSGVGTTLTLTNVNVLSNSNTGIRLTDGATVVMDGGQVSNQTTGGGFYLGSGTSENRTTLNLSNVDINNNAGARGVRLNNNWTEFIMNDGVVIRNHENGGVGIEGTNNIFRMNGGQIRNNRAINGAGVDISGSTNRVYMNGGVIGGEHGNAPDVNGALEVGGGAGNGAQVTAFRDHTRTVLIYSNEVTAQGGGVRVNNGASFILNRDVPYDGIPGAIIGNFSTSTTGTAWSAGGVAVVGDASTFRMYDGVIRGNWAGRNAGGVLVRHPNNARPTDANRPSFHLIGGSIEYNRSSYNASGSSNGYGGGGGITLSNHGTFYMGRNTEIMDLAGNPEIGAYIQKNWARATGGGVRMRDSSRFYMFSGSIIHNSGGGDSGAGNQAGGGGVFLEAEIGTASALGDRRHPSSFVMYSGTVSNNISRTTRNANASGGGGFMIHRGDLHFRGDGQKYIDGNISNSRGGGIYWRGETSARRDNSGLLITDGSDIRRTFEEVHPPNADRENTGLVSISNNRSVFSGGGMEIRGGIFKSRYFAIDSNWAGSDGGGINTNADVDIWGGSVSENFAGRALDGTLSNTIGNGGGINITDGGNVIIHPGTLTTINNNSAALDGGGINASGTGTIVSITNAEINDNHIRGTGEGGGIRNQGATITANDTWINYNTGATLGGGIFANSGTVTLNNSAVDGNTAEESGGGVYMGFHNTSPTLHINGSSISGNTALANSEDRGGGGVFLLGPTGTGTQAAANTQGRPTINMNGGAIDGNTAYRGGGVFLVGAVRNAGAGTSEGGLFNFNSGTINGNTAHLDGGGVYLRGGNRTGAGAGWANGARFNMAPGTIIDGNTAQRGGGVFVDRGHGGPNVRGSVFQMNGGVISNNHAYTAGGGVLLHGMQGSSPGASEGAGFTVAQGVIEGNTSQYSGGGVAVLGGSSTFVVNNGVIRNNRAGYIRSAIAPLSTFSNHGGGVFVDGGVYNSTPSAGVTSYVYGNHAMHGGGVAVVNGGRMEIQGSTVIGAPRPSELDPGQFNPRGNTADCSGGGLFVTAGGIVNTANTSATTTIVGNNAVNGGGGVKVGSVDSFGTFTIRNLDIIGNTAQSADDSETGTGGGMLVMASPGETVNAHSIIFLAGGTTNIRDNHAAYGGGIATIDKGFNVGSNHTLNIQNNFAGYNGGGMNIERVGFLPIHISEATQISGNTAGQNGGGISLDGIEASNNPTLDMSTINISGSDIFGNTALQNGGGIYVVGAYANLFITGATTIGAERPIDLPQGVPNPYGNTAHCSGGGIFIEQGLTDAGTTMSGNSRIIGNNALSTDSQRGGGGVSINSGSSFTMNQNSVIVSNTALSSGGGVLVHGQQGENISTFRMNLNTTVGGDRTLGHGNTVYNNGEDTFGGGIAVFEGALANLMSTSSVSGNQATFGGGVYVHGQQGTRRSTLDIRNTATIGGDSDGFGNIADVGGGVYLGLESQLTSAGTSTNRITGNRANLQGGGIAVFNVRPTGVNFSGHITNNRAQDGGGVFIQQNALIYLSNATITGNQATRNGGGIFTEDYSYANPADTTRYLNFNISGANISGNTAGEQFDPPDNHAEFTNRLPLTRRFNGLLLNNYQINYARNFEDMFVSKLLMDADWLDGEPIISEDTTSLFRFVITFRGSDGTYLPAGTQFNVVGGVLPSVNGATAPTINSITLDGSGSAVFYLANGQSIEILGVPVGSAVRIVEEIDEELYAATYTVLQRIGNNYVPQVRQGTVTDQSVTTDWYTIREVAGGQDTTNRFEWTNIRLDHTPPPTGLNIGGSSVWIVVAIGLIAVTGLVALTVIKARKKQAYYR